MSLTLQTVKNIRDLGGIKTEDGHVLKYKTILRSGDLHNISKSELDYLKKEYNLKTIIDFRSTNSFIKKKDMIDNSLNYRHTIVLKELDRTHYSIELEDPLAFMNHVYELLATCEESYAAYRLYFKWLLNFKDGSFLIHCTSGKDRTGIAVALLMYILGCSKEEIYKEYLRTNDFSKPILEKILNKNPNLNEHDYSYYYHFYLVKKEYLDIYFSNIENKFGSVSNFIKTKLKLSDDDIKILKQKFLED